MSRTKYLFPTLLLALSTSAHAEIRAYDVDARYRNEVFEALQIILARPHANMPQTGKVALLPTGQIMIDTDADRHAEIQAVLEAIERTEPSEAPSPSLRYWVLSAMPAEPGDRDRLPPILADVAAELEAIHGDLDISVLDSATLVGTPGTATSQSETLEIKQHVTPVGSRITADIVVQSAYLELSVRAPLSQGEYLVLGETPYRDENDRSGIVAFVVHWPAARN